MKDENVKEILKEYEKKRALAEARLECRKEDTYKKIPSLKKLDEQINLTGLKMARTALLKSKDKDKLLNEIKLEFENLKKQKDELIKKYGLAYDYFEPNYECKICFDKGYLKDGRKCNCFKQQLINKAYEMSNVSKLISVQNFNTSNPDLFSKEKFKDEGLTPHDNFLEMLSRCEDFSKCIKKNKDDKDNLLLYGNTGTGKTFMCSCIAKEFLERGHTVIYQTAFKLFDIMSEYTFKEENSNINKKDYDNIFNCDLLIIDDLGTEYTNNFTTNELFNIINTRLLNNKKTIISTNYNLKQLGDVYAQRIFSRIVDNFQLLRFYGTDLRYKKDLKIEK